MQEESRLLEAENEWRRSETPQALCVQYWASCAKLESKFSRQQLSSHEETLADAASLVAQERRLEEQEERARENRFVVCESSSRLTRLEEEAQQRHYWRQAMGTIEVHSTHIDQDDDEDIDGIEKDGGPPTTVAAAAEVVVLTAVVDTEEEEVTDEA